MRRSHDSSIPSRSASRMIQWFFRTSNNRFWFVWNQSGWAPYFTVGLFATLGLVSVFPDLVGAWVFYVVGIFSLAFFIDGIIVFMVDRHRARRGPPPSIQDR